ncbi:hypothetical protein [Metabacillus flavus]|uniref:hypothetical protein n=1 Tax=Metabacillus flavus TaxID=2823519 RepID=UPI003D65E400
MYRKDFYVFDENGPKPAVIRNYKETDFEGLIAIQQKIRRANGMEKSFFESIVIIVNIRVL